MRPAERSEIESWDELVRANPDGGHMLQTRAWGETKRRWGWDPAYMVWEGRDTRESGDVRAGQDPREDRGTRESRDVRVAILFLRRHLPGLGWLWYAPKGPGVDSPELLAQVLAERDAFAGAFRVEVEPELADTAGNRAALLAMGLKKGVDVQIARATVIVDLTPPEDEILAGFRSKTRYNVRLAARHAVGVTQEPCEGPAISAMHQLMGAAFNRADYPLRPESYYATYWRLFEASGQGALLVARLGDEVLAGAYVCWLGQKAWYKDGGSSLRHRELMAPHLLQWEAMRWLKRKGVTSYDLFAVPGRDEIGVRDHPLAGLWQFKSGFSTDLREFVGLWELVLQPRREAIWRKAAEPVVRRARWRLRHDLLY